MFKKTIDDNNVNDIKRDRIMCCKGVMFYYLYQFYLQHGCCSFIMPYTDPFVHGIAKYKVDNPLLPSKVS